ncbi:hypothetical protein MTO96_014542 [Rhipicephalus appendiculatus]
MPETTSQPVIRSHFVSRVTSLPVVSTALDTAKQSYNHVKDSSGLLGYTLSTAEKSAAYAVGHSLPLLEKFARPINYVDSLACKGLDRIEQSYPAVKQNSPQDIIKDAASFGLKKYVDARDYGVSLASQAVHAVSHPRETLTNAYQTWSQQARKQTVSALAAAEDTLDKELASLGVSIEKSHYEPEGEVPRRVASVVQKSRQVCVAQGSATVRAVPAARLTDSQTAAGGTQLAVQNEGRPPGRKQELQGHPRRSSFGRRMAQSPTQRPSPGDNQDLARQSPANVSKRRSPSRHRCHRALEAGPRYPGNVRQDLTRAEQATRPPSVTSPTNR